MSVKYFSKELPTQAFWYKDGTKAPCIISSQFLGLIAVDEEAEPEHLLELMDAAKKHIAGVTSITEAQFEEKKKLLESTPQAPAPQNPNPVRLFDPMAGRRMEQLAKQSPAPAATAPERPRTAPTATAPSAALIAEAPADYQHSTAEEAKKILPALKPLKPTTARMKRSKVENDVP